MTETVEKMTWKTWQVGSVADLITFLAQFPVEAQVMVQPNGRMVVWEGERGSGRRRTLGYVVGTEATTVVWEKQG